MDETSSEESSSQSDSEESNSDEKEVKITFYQWQKNEEGFLSKIEMSVDVGDALPMWQKHVSVLKRHIFTKRQQQQFYVNLKENISTNEMIVHLDYSENYKSTQQNEIQSAYFGNQSFSLFTCAYYRDMTDGKMAKIPLTITSQAGDKDRASLISCVNKMIAHLRDLIPNPIQSSYLLRWLCGSVSI